MVTPFVKSRVRPLVKIMRRILGVNALMDEILHVSNEISRLSEEIDFHKRDLLVALATHHGTLADPMVTLETQYPIAIQSDDHKYPRGTKNDNTRHPRFCYRCEKIFNRPLRFLDIGCAGGGLVLDFLLRGHLAIGLEGSDYSLRSQRAEWRLIPHHLFTCDVTKPFRLISRLGGKGVQFDVISAWEVLEHLPEDTLSQFFSNVADHLACDGIFVASVATFEDKDPQTGAIWHVTVKPREWWMEIVRNVGLVPANGLFEVADFPRGSWGHNPCLRGDWNPQTDPKAGFHLVLRKG